MKNCVPCFSAVGEKLELTLVKDSECFATKRLPSGAHLISIVQTGDKPVCSILCYFVLFYPLFLLFFRLIWHILSTGEFYWH